MRDEQEINDAVENYSDLIRRICFLHLKNRQDTEDISQKVFLKYILYSGTFENEEHERAWFVRVTINACKDFLRTAFWKNKVPLELMEEEAQTMEEADREVLEAVLSLPVKYKNVIYLFYYEGFSAVEIAQMMKKKENTVYTLLARGRKLLKEKLGGDGIE